MAWKCSEFYLWSNVFWCFIRNASSFLSKKEEKRRYVETWNFNHIHHCSNNHAAMNENHNQKLNQKNLSNTFHVTPDMTRVHSFLFNQCKWRHYIFVCACTCNMHSNKRKTNFIYESSLLVFVFIWIYNTHTNNCNLKE